MEVCRLKHLIWPVLVYEIEHTIFDLNLEILDLDGLTKSPPNTPAGFSYHLGHF